MAREGPASNSVARLSEAFRKPVITDPAYIKRCRQPPKPTSSVSLFIRFSSLTSFSLFLSVLFRLSLSFSFLRLFSSYIVRTYLLPLLGFMEGFLSNATRSIEYVFQDSILDSWTYLDVILDPIWFRWKSRSRFVKSWIIHIFRGLVGAEACKNWDKSGNFACNLCLETS